MFFVTAGYHRYFSHRSFKTSRWFQFVIAFMAMSSSQKGVLWWAAHHRHITAIPIWRKISTRHALRLLVVAHRMDSFRRYNGTPLRLHRRLRPKFPSFAGLNK